MADKDPWETPELDPWEASQQEATFVDPEHRTPQPLPMYAAGLQAIGRGVDRISAAPIRGALGNLQKPQGRLDQMSLGQSIMDSPPGRILSGAFQGVRDPESVPTGKQVAAGFGLSERPISTVGGVPVFPEGTGPSLAGIGGFALDFAAPLPPIAKGFKLGQGLLKETARGGVRAGALTHELITGSEAGRDVVQGVESAFNNAYGKGKGQLQEAFNPQRAKDFDQIKAAADKFGINITPAMEYGKLSTPARREMGAAQGSGQEATRKLEDWNKTHDQIQEAYQGTIEKIGGKPLDAAQAGEVIRNGVFDGLKRLRENTTVTNDKIIEMFPGLEVNGKELKDLNSKINGVEKFAKGRVARGIDEQVTDANKLLKQIENLRNTNASYKQLNEAREAIGEIAFAKKGTLERTPLYEQEMRDLYFGLNDALMGTVRKIDRVKANQFRIPGAPPYEELAQQLESNNKIISEALGDKGALRGVIGNSDKAGSDIFQQALVNGDERIVKALKTFLTPQEIQKLKSTYLAAKTKVSTDGSTILYGQTRKAIHGNNQLPDPVTKSLFEPGELNDLNDAIMLGDRQGPPLLPGSAGQIELSNPLTQAGNKALGFLGDIAHETGRARSSRLGPITSTPVASDAVVTAVRKKANNVPKIKLGLRALRAESNALHENGGDFAY